MRTIEIQGVEATALKQLVDYCYTGEENTLKLSIRSFIAPILSCREDQPAGGHRGECDQCRLSASAPCCGRGLLLILCPASAPLQLHRDQTLCR